MFKPFIKSILLILIIMGCAGTPIRWISTAEYPNTNYDRAWQTVVSTITEEFDIDVIEKDSGYLLTAWKPVETTFGESISGWERAAIRVTCKVENRDPFRLKLRVQRAELEGGQWVAKASDEKWEKELLEQIELRLK